MGAGNLQARAEGSSTSQPVDRTSFVQETSRRIPHQRITTVAHYRPFAAQSELREATYPKGQGSLNAGPLTKKSRAARWDRFAHTCSLFDPTRRHHDRMSCVHLFLSKIEEKHVRRPGELASSLTGLDQPQPFDRRKDM